MNNYVMFEVTVYRNQANGVLIRCTDPATILWVLKRIQKMVPTTKLEQAFPDAGKPIIGWLRNLSGNDNNVPWMIVSILCNNGWEPFAASITDYSDRYFLRAQKNSSD
jgi:hypothetical protein